MGPKKAQKENDYFVRQANFTLKASLRKQSRSGRQWRQWNVAKKTTKRKKASTRKGQSVNARLREKAKGSKFTASQLRKVYNRGLAAWISSGSRKGMSQHAWAMARVNSFLRGGPARKVDMPMFRKKRKKK
tara:strand:- start:423 stop:815 length:393 start_codon:yes stop_codon:yes gene_type:complete